MGVVETQKTSQSTPAEASKKKKTKKLMKAKIWNKKDNETEYSISITSISNLRLLAFMKEE